MHYRGTLEDGTEFDSSHSRGPFKFPLGAGRVIQGWDQGLLGISSKVLYTCKFGVADNDLDMCVGEKRKLIIPYQLAYGERGVGPIPAKSNLIFETELLEIAGVKSEL